MPGRLVLLLTLGSALFAFSGCRADDANNTSKADSNSRYEAAVISYVRSKPSKYPRRVEVIDCTVSVVGRRLCAVSFENDPQDGCYPFNVFDEGSGVIVRPAGPDVICLGEPEK